MTATALNDPTAWEQVVDPSQTFLATVPRGWQRQLQAVRPGSITYQLVSTTSPDGRVSLRIGDPQLPLFAEPGTPYQLIPDAVVRPTTPAAQFVNEWLQHNQQALPGSTVVGMADCPPLLQAIAGVAQRTNIPLQWGTAVQVELRSETAQNVVRHLVLLATTGIAGLWTAQVQVVTMVGGGDPADFADALVRMVGSVQATPQELQRRAFEQQQSALSHQLTMQNIAANTAAMTARHQQNMANIHASAQAHQQHMADLQAGYAAHNAAWADQQAGFDAQQQAWHQQQSAADAQQASTINAIREERTVVDSFGQTHQVADGFDSYFYRQHDNSWIGLHAHQQLSDVPGIDPGDYEEVRIQR